MDYIRYQGKADRKQVSTYVRSLSLSKIDFSDEDIYRILETQVYDGKIEAVNDENNRDYHSLEIGAILPNKTYIATNWYVPKMTYSLLK